MDVIEILIDHEQEIKKRFESGGLASLAHLPVASRKRPATLIY